MKKRKKVILIILIILLLPHLMILCFSAVQHQNIYKDLYYHLFNPHIKVTVNAEVYIDELPVTIDEKSVTVNMDYAGEMKLPSNAIITDKNKLTIKNHASYGFFDYSFFAGDYKITLNLPHLNEWEVNKYTYVISIDTKNQQIEYDYNYSYPEEITYKTITKTGKITKPLQKENTISQYHEKSTV